MATAMVHHLAHGANLRLDFPVSCLAQTCRGHRWPPDVAMLGAPMRQPPPTRPAGACRDFDCRHRPPGHTRPLARAASPHRILGVEAPSKHLFPLATARSRRGRSHPTIPTVASAPQSSKIH